jgi:predicted nucleic acid-binding protein
MVRRVLDTSVIVKWFFSEDGTDRAEGFLAELENDEGDVLVPSSFFYEFSNVLWVKRREGVDEEAAVSIWEELIKLPLIVVDWTDVLPQALAFGYRHEVSPYDAAFVILAQQEQCEFVTADMPLWRKLHQDYPWIKKL